MTSIRCTQIDDPFRADLSHVSLDQGTAVKVIMFASIFARDSNWRTLTERLPAAGVLEVSAEELERVLGN